MYEKILVAVDGIATSERALTEAIKLATLTDARLRLVNVVEDPTCAIGRGRYPVACSAGMLKALKDAGEQVLDKARAAARAHRVDVDTALIENIGGRVSDSILEEAVRCGAGLLVLGTHGRRGFRRFMLGSDAEQILCAARVPVLLVRSDEPEAAPQATATMRADTTAQIDIRP